MKKLSILLVAIHITLFATAQLFKKDEPVEVEPSLSESPVDNWKKAELIQYDSVAKSYLVKLSDGKKVNIPSQSPEKWIRPVASKLAMLGPDKQIRYEKSSRLISGFSCRPSETYIKKNVKARIAEYFNDYPQIFVDITSFKAQNGYEDPKNKGQFIYPYKIEMRVYLKRTLLFGGEEYYEFQTWEFDREYEYATRPGKQCEFYPLKLSDAKKLSGGWYKY